MVARDIVRDDRFGIIKNSPRDSGCSDCVYLCASVLRVPASNIASPLSLPSGYHVG